MLEAIVLTAILTTAPTPVMPKDAPIQTGYQPSAYTGDYYREDQEPYRKCVGEREGRFQYWGTGSNGYYESTYQMTDALVRGAAWMIRPELKEMFGKEEGKRIGDILLDTPGSKWHRFYMDMAFYTILNYEGEWSGKFHWKGGRWSC